MEAEAMMAIMRAMMVRVAPVVRAFALGWEECHAVQASKWRCTLHIKSSLSVSTFGFHWRYLLLKYISLHIVPTYNSGP